MKRNVLSLNLSFGTHYLPFHHFFLIFSTISINCHKEGVFHCALAEENYSLSSNYHAFSLDFQSNRGRNTRPQIRALTLLLHQILVSTLLSACVSSVLPTTQSLPQSQPQALSPEHWVSCIPGLFLLSSEFPDSHFLDMNSQGCSLVQLAAQLPPL